MNETRQARKAEARLAKMRAREELYGRKFAERMLEDEHTGILLLNRRFRIVRANAVACRWLGLERDELFGWRMDRLLVTLGLRPEPADRSLLRGEPLRDRLLAIGAPGRQRQLMMDGDALFEGDRVIGAYVLLRDVTRLLQLQEQVRQADRLQTIGQIAAGTAHEIRNPLTSIQGFMQILYKTLAEREMEKERDYVGIVLEELSRVNGLLRDFLLLSKPKEVRPAPVRIPAIVDELLPMIRHEAMLCGIGCGRETAADLPPVAGDRELVKQVILNLCKNAIEAMETGGTLTIRERLTEDGCVAVEIGDTGPGVPAELLERIFDPFFTTKPEGTGLGLAICRQIAHELGGRIRAESAPGRTVFAMALPAVGPDDAAAGAGGNGGAAPVN